MIQATEGRKGRLPAHGIFHSDLAIYVKLPQATSLAASNQAREATCEGADREPGRRARGMGIKGQKRVGDTKGGGWEVGVSLK